MSAMKLSAFVVLAAVLCLMPLTGGAETLEYPYLYKSPRAMGMGGAYTAVGGRVDTLFYNPAALINIPRDKGWEMDLINLSAEIGANGADLATIVTKGKCGDNTFCQDMQDALDSAKHPTDVQQQRAVNEVLAKYRGKNMHVRVADFTAVGKSWDRFAFGVGGIGSGRVDLIAHQGFGSEGLLEMNADAIYGAVGGVGFGITEELFLGIGIKSLHRESLIHNFTSREIVEHQDNFKDYLTKDLRLSGDAVGADAGLIWLPAKDSYWKPSVGVSVLNIGDLDFQQAGVIPQTVNVGVAVSPTISWARSLTIAADYVDVLKGFKQDTDSMKRLRYGAELQLFDTIPFELALRAGMYEMSPTFGIDARLLFLTVSYTQYTEELGAYAGQDKDVRKMVTLNLGW